MGPSYHTPAGGKQQKVSGHYQAKPRPKQELEEIDDDDWEFGSTPYKPPCPVALKIKKDHGQGNTPKKF